MERIMEYVMPIIIIIVMYFWTTIIAKNAPIYGEHIVYNLFYPWIGQQFYGNKIKGSAKCSFYENKNMNINKNIGMNIRKNTKGGFNLGEHTIWSKIYAYIITIISIITYVFNGNLVDGKTMLSIFGSKTFLKALLGYVPAQDANKIGGKTWFNEFMQYRVNPDGGFLEKVGALIRRFKLFGLDTPSLDEIFHTFRYNRINDDKTLMDNYCEKMKTLSQESYITRWIYETWIYWSNWLRLSSISIIFAIVLVLIQYIK